MLIYDHAWGVPKIKVGTNFTLFFKNVNFNLKLKIVLRYDFKNELED